MIADIEERASRRVPGTAQTEIRPPAPELEHHAAIGSEPGGGAVGVDWFSQYDTGGFYDEMFARPGVPRPHYERLHAALAAFGPEEFRRRCALADLSLMHQGITFTVYGDQRGVERPWPLDLIPRILPAAEWDRLERGLKQRIYALNLFLHDVYHEGRILSDRVIRRDLVVTARGYRPEMLEVDVPGRVYCHIVGTDLIRDGHGEF